MAWVIVVLAMAGCARVGSHAERVKDISGLVPDLAFEMTDEQGRAVSARDFEGRPVLLFFGFTHCPDECPTTLADLSKASKAVGPNATRILFVTVDPARDSRARLDEYVHAFGGPITGLRGDAAHLEALAKRYRVSYSLEKPDAHGDYDVNHSSAVFGFDGRGHARLMILPRATIADMQAALAMLSASGA